MSKNSNKTPKFKRSRSFVFKRAKLLLFIFFFFFLAKNFIAAQSVSNIDNSAVVTATVPDHVAPSTPILIAPADESNLSIAYPVFQWYGSSDNMGLSHYRFWMDNATFFDNIPLTDFANSNYSLDYEESSNIYTFVATDPLEHGAHRWQIIAVDQVDNSAASDIWDFNIFINDPEFTITDIADVSTSIEATDPSTVPTNPIEIFTSDPTANEPIIIAQADPNVAVELVVTIPDDPTQTFSLDSDDAGNWQLQLGILPRDENIRLDFVITDVVGNESRIESLYIILFQHYWPPTETPTPTVTPTDTPTTTPTASLTSTVTPTWTPTPSFSISPSISQPTTSLTPSLSPSLSLTASPSASPTLSLAPPGIRVPIIPPKEIVHEVVQETVERLPKQVGEFLTQMVRSTLWQLLKDALALILALLLPLTLILALNLKFVKNWTPIVMRQVLLALWPWPKRRPNLVFEARQSVAAPLVKVELIDQDTNEVLAWQLTNYLGNFANFNWPKNKNLRLNIKDNSFFYPVGDKKPIQLNWQSYYQNEVFREKSFNQHRVFAIPTLLAQGRRSLSLIERLVAFFAYLVTYPWWYWAVATAPVLLLALRYPTILNYFGLLYFVLVAIGKTLNRVKTPAYRFNLSTNSGKKLRQNLIVVANDLLNGKSQALVAAVEVGLSTPLHFPCNLFLLSIFAQNYSYWDGQGAIAQAYCRLGQNKELAIKLFEVGTNDNNFKTLQPRCQLLPPQST